MAVGACRRPIASKHPSPLPPVAFSATDRPLCSFFFLSWQFAADRSKREEVLYSLAATTTSSSSAGCSGWLRIAVLDVVRWCLFRVGNLLPKGLASSSGTNYLLFAPSYRTKASYNVHVDCCCLVLRREAGTASFVVVAGSLALAGGPVPRAACCCADDVRPTATAAAMVELLDDAETKEEEESTTPPSRSFLLQGCVVFHVSSATFDVSRSSIFAFAIRDFSVVL